MRIDTLTCNVTVTTGELGSPMGRSEGSPAPSMSFAMVPPEVQSGRGASQPSDLATAQAVDSGEGQTADPRTADPGLVANRVYDLMKEELRLAIMRGAKSRKGWGSR
jgi:hypothetical protein